MKNLASKILFSSLIACLTVFTLPVASVLALSSGGVGGYPANPDPSVQYSESWFIYNLDLGESKDDAVLVFNAADEPKAVKIYAVDSTPSNQGNFALKAEGDPNVGVGGWIELSASLVTTNLHSALHFAERIEAGIVKVNQPTTGVAVQAPFGGLKKSSSNTFREQGKTAIEFFSQSKTVYIKY